LDEPTTGMDVGAQHRIWNLIKKHKKGKVVILTTHSMEEAEVLGDCIGIMSKGEIKTCGTILFLKNKLGAGYSLQIEKDPTRFSDSDILDVILQYFPGSVIDSSTPTTCTLLLNQKDNVKSFRNFFNQIRIDLANDHLKGLGNITLKTTTLEEIFLKLREDSENHAEN
jgi:ABC-type multidrug transport system ATPase subunit